MVLKVSSKLTPGLGIIKEAIPFHIHSPFSRIMLEIKSINSVMTIFEGCADVRSQINSQELPTFHYLSGGQRFGFFFSQLRDHTSVVFMGVMHAMLLAFIQVEQEVLSYTGRLLPQDRCGTHTSSTPTSRQTSKMYVKGKQSMSQSCLA